MTSAKGYRLKLNSIIELSTWLDDYRATSLRQLGKMYGTMVAKKAVEYLDYDRMGINDLPEDVFAKACSDVRKLLGKSPNGIIAPDINLSVKFHFVHDAILATFNHGNDEYLKTWESNKSVVKWGWSASSNLNDIPEHIWRVREKYWAKANARKIGGDFQFILVDRPLPDIGWGSIWRYLPSNEQRIATTIEALKESDPTGLTKRFSGQKLQETVFRSIDREITKNSFLKSNRTRNYGAKKIRQDVAVARKQSVAKDINERIEAKERQPVRASEIDHADVIVASDNKIFVAVPYVGLDPDSRVFVQVSDKHVTFSQNGVQYGFVDNVKSSSLDILKSTNQVILVEIEKNFDERLLRAKHIAIVTNISLQDGFGSAINRFKQITNTAIKEKELKEWEKQ